MKRVFFIGLIVCLPLVLFAQWERETITYPDFRTSSYHMGETTLPVSTVTPPFENTSPSAASAPRRAPGGGHSGGTSVETPGLSVGEGLVPLSLMAFILVVYKYEEKRKK